MLHSAGQIMSRNAVFVGAMLVSLVLGLNSIAIELRGPLGPVLEPFLGSPRGAAVSPKPPEQFVGASEARHPGGSSAFFFGGGGGGPPRSSSGGGCAASGASTDQTAGTHRQNLITACFSLAPA